MLTIFLVKKSKEKKDERKTINHSQQLVSVFELEKSFFISWVQLKVVMLIKELELHVYKGGGRGLYVGYTKYFKSSCKNL